MFHLKPIYINGLGLCNPLGTSAEEVAKNLFAGSQAGMVERTDLLNHGNIYVGQVSATLPDLSHFPKHFQSRNNQLALMAYQQIESIVDDLKAEYSAHRIGVILGSSTSGIAQGEEAMLYRVEQGNFPDSYDYQVQELSNPAEFISEYAGIQGYVSVISTACSSSAKTFITAAEMIHAGLLDAVIVGGVDSLCGMTVNGFSALESTSSAICNPSSVNRDGINIGEAAALAVVSGKKSAIKLCGGGESSDAHHMSAPHPEGQGAMVAMQQAINNAGLSADNIDYINLHGTATPKNDEMEAIAVSSIFTDKPYVSSTKGYTGHTLGAAGATEIAFCYLALQQQKMPEHLWDGAEDPAMPTLNWVSKRSNLTKRLRYCLSNSFAFGGNNVSLVIGLSDE
ncbi:beta-ketoacyl-[acyl-carrier-protein] synthase family protein [Paraglaciecola sp. L3A3]|uniref:beta-ketoacyl-[acyl-carrier-protein] synthase family protein n=1 Tax=Paraglaciecola sp. L3A3 TaxID=2686358 RepID=UPI001E55EA6D|nr:beta-ketoacyl-[acyl-carrier-protein] synthase family protein [Paraglaciecola sp. L3A3]